MDHREEFLEVSPFVFGQKYPLFYVCVASTSGFYSPVLCMDTLCCLQPIERDPLIYHLDSTSRHTEELGDLPDEFFEVTVDDVRKRFAQLKSER